MHEIAEFFKRADTPFQNKNNFLRGMYEAHAQLKTCVSIIFFYTTWYSSQIFMVNKTDNMYAENVIENFKDYTFK